MTAAAQGERNRPIGSRPDWVAELFDKPEREACQPPERTTTWRWASNHRYLSRRQSPRSPGRWNDVNQPTLRGIMALFTLRWIREIWIKKAVQIGASEAVRNEIGRRADQDPNPLLLVLPNEKKGREIVRKRIIPLFEETERLRALLTGRKLDFKLTAISLVNGFDLSLGWSGSATSLASDPMSVVILDEVDKFEQIPGREADPVDLARVRLRTLEEQQRSLLIGLSTPTTDDGPVAREYEDCPIKLYYFVPCPHCGTFQRLVFDRLSWRKPDAIDSLGVRSLGIGPAIHGAMLRQDSDSAWFDCVDPNCKTTHPHGDGRIHHHHKRQILQRGYWGTEDGSWKIWFEDGREEGKPPPGTKVGVHLPALYDVSVAWSSIAAEYVEANGRPDKTQHFYNATLAETFKLSIGAPSVSDAYARMCVPDPDKGFVPPPAKKLQPWVSRLLMTVDTQKNHFYWVVRGYGPHAGAFRSHRVDHGIALAFEDLEEIFYRSAYPYVGDIYPALRCYRLGIDPRGGTYDEDRPDANRTEQVYVWCNKDPNWRLPLVGNRPFDGHIRLQERSYQPLAKEKAAFSVKQFLWDSVWFRDILFSFISARLQDVNPQTGEVVGTVPQWMLNDHNDDGYNRQMSNIMKARIRKGRGYVELYKPKTEGARHDYPDCEAMQVVLALYPGQCTALMTPAALAEQMRPSQLNSAGMRMPDGRPWLPGNR